MAKVAYVNPDALYVALPYCLLWALTPLIVHILDKPIKRTTNKNLSDADLKMLRNVARMTWRYFDEFVNSSTHWLPPDNYQSALNIQVAQRTSPTNIGLWFLVLLDAYDLGYISLDTLVERANHTLDTLKKVERYEGHLLNWYNTQTLEPLYPRYISTVDSGNLVACLWTMEQGIREIISSAPLSPNLLKGLQDTYHLAADKPEGLHDILHAEPKNPFQLIEIIRKALSILQPLMIQYNPEYWLAQLGRKVIRLSALAARYYSWLDIVLAHTEEIADGAKITEILALNPSVKELASPDFQTHFTPIIDRLPPEVGKELQAALVTTQWAAGELLKQADRITAELEELSKGMNLQYLYNRERRLFAIGYNVDERRLDTSYYDLLASEARIASLVAIAKEDLPVEHWWALGRPYTLVNRRRYYFHGVERCSNTSCPCYSIPPIHHHFWDKPVKQLSLPNTICEKKRHPLGYL